MWRASLFSYNGRQIVKTWSRSQCTSRLHMCFTRRGFAWSEAHHQGPRHEVLRFSGFFPYYCFLFLRSFCTAQTLLFDTAPEMLASHVPFQQTPASDTLEGPKRTPFSTASEALCSLASKLLHSSSSQAFSCFAQVLLFFRYFRRYVPKERLFTLELHFLTFASFPLLPDVRFLLFPTAKWCTASCPPLLSSLCL